MTPTAPTADTPLQVIPFQPQPPGLMPAPSVTAFGVATSHRQVRDCWQVVHECYVEAGLIAPNPFGLHTSRQAVSEDTTVIYGRTHGRIDCTLSVIPDGPLGLPLDQVYKSTLDNLRSRGHKLVEVGLLADARTDASRSLDQAFGTMRLGLYRAYYSDADIVIGVHPRHADFYVRMMGLEVIGHMSHHPTVNNRPVILLRLDISRIRFEPLPRLLRYIKANPVDADIFDSRYRFPKAGMGNSAIARFLDHADNLRKITRFQTHADSLPMQHAVSL